MGSGKEGECCATFSKEIILPYLTDPWIWKLPFLSLRLVMFSHIIFFAKSQLHCSGDQSTLPQIVSPPFGIKEMMESQVRETRIRCRRVWSPRIFESKTPDAIDLHGVKYTSQHNSYNWNKTNLALHPGFGNWCKEKSHWPVKGYVFALGWENMTSCLWDSEKGRTNIHDCFDVLGTPTRTASTSNGWRRFNPLKEV